MKVRIRTGKVTERLNVLIKFDAQCVVCGNDFANLACVTYEHLKPRSLGGGLRGGNIGPSHANCNSLRGNESLIAAAKKVDKLRRRMGKAKFSQWLAKRPPSDTLYTGIALLPLKDFPAKRFLNPCQLEKWKRCFKVPA